MCGRFTLSVSSEVLAEVFNLESVPPLEPRFNIAPSQAVAVVWVRPVRRVRELAILQWGLIPAWAEDPAIGSRLINARAETVAEKPAFRAAFRYRRCLMLADGFYEWKGKGKERQPYYFRLKGGLPFAFAALWEHWSGADGSDIETCTLLTTAANRNVATVHDRMPVILPPQHYGLWLDPTVQDTRALENLLCPYPPEAMEAYPVSNRVNSPFDDEPEFIMPLAQPAEDSRFPLV